jgi:HTH-type transcriptional regulator / antitoxin HipB
MQTLIRNPKALGNLIQSKRKALRLSQAEFAERVGLRQPVISQVEKGHAALKLDTLLVILAALDLDLTVGSRAKGSIHDFATML